MFGNFRLRCVNRVFNYHVTTYQTAAPTALYRYEDCWLHSGLLIRRPGECRIGRVARFVHHDVFALSPRGTRLMPPRE